MLAILALLSIAIILRTKGIMSNRYKRKAVLQALYTKAKEVCDKVYTTSRPTATEQMDSFILIRLPQGIYPYADTHNTTYAQMICYVRDRQGGVENVDLEEELVEGITSIFPFNDELLSCNSAPLILESKSDGMGFHSTVIQFKVVIKV